MTDNCKHVAKIKTSIQLGILSPEHWHCSDCQTTESVWACLSCSNFACGRYISEHALHHFQQTNHPLCIEVNEKFVFCYICDDFILNDNAPGDIKLLRMALDAVTAQDFGELSKQKRGRRILRYHVRDVKRNNQRLLKADDIQTAVVRQRISRLSWVFYTWWMRYVEHKRILSRIKKGTSSGKLNPLTLSPAFTGLRNLGNTCYMNSILQILRHTAPFGNFIMNHTLDEVIPQSQKRRYDNAIGISAHESKYFPNKRLSTNASGIGTSVYNCTIATESLVSVSGHKTHLNDSDRNCIDHVTGRSDFIKMHSPGGLNGGQSFKVLASDNQNSLSVTMTNEQSQSFIPFLYQEIHNLFKTLWSGQRTVVTPSNLLYAVWTALPTFKGYKQQDAQEFLSLFLDRLQAELHGGLSTNMSTTTQDFINRAFKGFCVSHICCSSCRLITCTEEPIFELSLPLPSNCYSGESSNCTLLDLLRQYVSPTAIDGATYACRNCNDRFSKLGNDDHDQINCTHSSLEQYTYAENTPYIDNKYVSVAVSRLPSSVTNIQPTYIGFSSSSELIDSSSTSSSSLSESVLSASPSLDDLDVKTSLPKVFNLVNNPSSINYSPNNSRQMASDKLLNNSNDVPLLTCATQTIRLSRLPKVLRFHIKRFRWIGRQREKLTCHVSFPLILDMTEFMLSDLDRAQCGHLHVHDGLNTDMNLSQSNIDLRTSTHIDISRCSSSSSLNYSKAPNNDPKRQYLYYLTGVVVHHGRGFQSGHYTAYCLNDEPECWLHCNDAHVSLCDFAEVSSAQAYLLFYSELVPKSPVPDWLNLSTRISASFVSNVTTTTTTTTNDQNSDNMGVMLSNTVPKSPIKTNSKCNYSK